MHEIDGLLEDLARKGDYACKTEYRIGDINFTLRADSSDVIDGFTNYTTTKSEPFSDSPNNCRVSFTKNTELEIALRTHCEKNGSPHWAKRDVCFTLLKLDNFVLYCSDFDEITNSMYTLISSGNEHWIVARESVETVSRVPVRILREVLLRTYENRGGCFVHCAAFAKSDSNSGAIIIGDAGAGKSTTVWQMSKLPEFDYISNDKSIVYAHDNQIDVLGWPLSARLGIGMLASTGNLEKYRTADKVRHQVDTLFGQDVASSEAKRKNWGCIDKLELTTRELHKFDGIESVPGCKLSFVIIPKLDMSGDPLKLERVDGNEYRDLIARNILEPYDKDIGRGWMGIRTVSDAFLMERKQELLDTLCSMEVYTISGDAGQFSSDSACVVELCSKFERAVA